MKFIVRGAKTSDLEGIYNLSTQFSLLNLPADKDALSKKIYKSKKSFKGDIDKTEAQYLFVLEDLESNAVVGSAQIVGKHGTPDRPNYSFEVLKKEKFSQELGVGFIHQILRLKINEDGGTEVGGLVLNSSYRSRPEKLGKVLSLIRFVYIGMCLDKFEKTLYAEMAPPLTREGRSEFWEALGRRFTGMPYQEADTLSHNNKEFIRSLFPEEDIYLCLLDAKARLVLGRVGESTRPALRLLESVGFKYKDEVDPFDGGPHLGCMTKEISLIKNGNYYEIDESLKSEYTKYCIFGIIRENDFFGGYSAFYSKENKVTFPHATRKALNLVKGEKVYITEVG